MIDNILTAFILKGKIAGLVPGETFPNEPCDWVSSVDVYEDGFPKFYQGNCKGWILNVGVTEDRKIRYITVHLEDQEMDCVLKLGDIELDLKKATLDEILMQMNTNAIKWKFSSILENLIYFRVEESGVEFIYSFYPDEYGLNVIQKIICE